MMSLDFTQLNLEAKLFKSFGDSSRLAILELLSEKEKTVSEIVQETEFSQPNVSMDLSYLFGCGLVKKRKDGRNIFYQLSGEEVGEVIEVARKIISQHSKELFECTRY